MIAMKTCYFTGILAGLALAGTSGCSSFMSHSGPDQGYYSGTRASAKIIADSNSGWVMRPLAAIDLPFSAVMDTLLLPWDYYRAGSDKALDSPMSACGAVNSLIIPMKACQKPHRHTAPHRDSANFPLSLQ